MRVEFQGKNMQVSDSLKDRVTDKLGKFDKYFQSERTRRDAYCGFGGADAQVRLRGFGFTSGSDFKA